MFFMQTGVFNTAALSAMTYAAEKMRQWQEWQDVRPFYNEAMKHYWDYERFMRTSEMQGRFQLFTDMADIANENVKHKKRDVTANMARVAAEHGARHSLTVAHVFLALLCIDYSTDVYDSYNREMSRRLGVSFNSPRYKRIRLTKTREQWMKIIEVINSEGLTSKAFEQDKKCYEAMEAYFSALKDFDNINNSSMEAIEQNRHLFTEEELDELREQHESGRNTGSGDTIGTLIDDAVKAVGRGRL